MKTFCIYHANCDDGFGAAYAVWKALGDTVQFVAANYGDPPPDVAGQGVIIVDFSYKRPVLIELAQSAAWLKVIDHHKTAAEDLRELWLEPALEGAAVEVLFDMDRSGAGLAWDTFHLDEPRPALIDYIEDRDLWRKRLPGVDEFTMALRSYPQDFRVWDAFWVPALIQEGSAIKRYYRTLVEQAKAHSYRREIGGYAVPCVNASLFMASELAGELAAGEPFAAVYAQTADGVIYSLRSRAPDGMDVSEIARKFGGGGHKHAAGFKVPRG